MVVTARPCRLDRQHQAGADGNLVHEHRTGAADAVLATQMRAS